MSMHIFGRGLGVEFESAQVPVPALVPDRKEALDRYIQLGI